MAKAGSKHLNQRRVPLPDLSLGIDISKNAESIPESALVQAENLEYNHVTGAPRTSAGVKVLLDHGTEVKSGFKDIYNDVHLFNSGQELYTTDFVTTTHIGTLTGANKPVYCLFNGKILIASGGHLQQWDGTTLTTITASPNCIFVMESEARAGVLQLNNEWRLSGTRDATNWTENTEMDSIFIEIGDNSPLKAVSRTADDLVFYKENSIHRLKGKYPDWVVVDSTTEISCMNTRSVKSVNNASYFIGNGGFMKLRATDTYSEIDPFEEGLNVNSYLAKNIDNNAEIFHILHEKKFYIKTQNDKGVYVYHYLPRYPDGRGAFTHRTFTHQLNDVWTDGNKTYIAYGNKIGVLDPTSDKDDGQQIKMALRSKRFTPERLVLIIKYMKLEIQNIVSGYGSIQLFNEPIPLTFDATDGEIWDDEEEIDSDTTDIALEEFKAFEEFGLGSDEYAQIQIFTESGSIEIRAISLDMA